MAKRKRLTPAQPGYLDGGPVEGMRAPETKAMPISSAPIAQVAGDASTHAALHELENQILTARQDGRLIEDLELARVDDSYLVRDRIEQDEDEMGALMNSLRARGQQTAIEVIKLPLPKGVFTHGLISGWRRLTALRRLYAETKDPKFAKVRVRTITPQNAQAAYVAMVEENEIRVNLSLYERARITIHAMRVSVYPTRRIALRGLFGSTTSSRRSKIGTFIAVVDAFDDMLKFPTAITEKLGLSLARELKRDPDFVSKVRVRLESNPDRTAAEELRLLAATITAAYPPAPEPTTPTAPTIITKTSGPARKTSSRPASPVVREFAASGVSVSFYPAKDKIELAGSNVDDSLRAALMEWLATR